MKKCFKCGAEKELTEFYKHPQMGDGYLGKCKDCAKKDVLNHRLKDLGRIREYDRQRGKLPHRIKGCVKYNKDYRKKNPLRYIANNCLSNAVRDGYIQKPKICSVCGEKRRIYGHHKDYSLPLEVKWVCQVCHKAIHNGKT